MDSIVPDRINLGGVRIGCAMTGSFCTFRAAFDAWRALRATGAELIPILSFNAGSLDNRFYTAADSRQILTEICGHEILDSVPAVEPIGPKKLLDLLIVAPCTGNTLAKIAAGITDTPVALAVKSHLRNARPVLLAISTNDALSGSAQNARLLTVPGSSLLLLSGDKTDEQPQRLLDCDKMCRLMALLRTKLDYVIIDSPPAGILSDAATIASSVDAALYVVRQDLASAGQIQDSIQALAAGGVDLLGCVLNCTQAGTTRRGYGGRYSGYAYGYKYADSYSSHRPRSASEPAESQ